MSIIPRGCWPPGPQGFLRQGFEAGHLVLLVVYIAKHFVLIEAHLPSLYIFINLYTSLYILIHLYTSLYTSIHLYTSLYFFIHLYTSLYIFIHLLYIFIHLYTSLYIFIHLYTSTIHLYTSLYIFIHLYTSLYIFIHLLYIFIHLYTFLYIFIHLYTSIIQLNTYINRVSKQNRISDTLDIIIKILFKYRVSHETWITHVKVNLRINAANYFKDSRNLLQGLYKNIEMYKKMTKLF